MNEARREERMGARAWALGAALVAAAAVKLLLTSAQPVFAVPANRLDDGLFVDLAGHVAAGGWLGPYDERTLVKGPVYPVWLAVVHLVGAPLPLAQGLLYAAACAAFAAALRRFVSTGVAAALFVVLLMNPMTFTGDALRVTREGIYPALTLLVLAAAISVAPARHRGPLALTGRALALGLALGLFWHTREEGVWILPSVAIVLTFVGARPGAGARAAVPRVALASALALAVVGVASAVLAASNAAHYGVPATTELNAGPFVDAAGALSRARAKDGDVLVPLPRDARIRLYAVSPAFRELAPLLEGPVGRSWAALTAVVLPELAGSGEVGGGWWLWALRDAAARAGHHASGGEAMAYYARLAAEVNAACTRGALACGPARRTLAPRLRAADVAPILRATGAAVANVVGLRGFSAWTPASRGTPAEIERVARFIGHEVSPPAGSPEPRPRVRVGLLQIFGTLEARMLPLAGLVATGAYGWAVWRGRRRILELPVLPVCGALLAGVIVRCALVATLDVTSFPANNPVYLGPAYPLWLAFCVLAPAQALALRRRDAGAVDHPTGGSPEAESPEPSTGGNSSDRGMASKVGRARPA